jgi:hypothetical protein
LDKAIRAVLACSVAKKKGNQAKKVRILRQEKSGFRLETAMFPRALQA